MDIKVRLHTTLPNGWKIFQCRRSMSAFDKGVGQRPESAKMSVISATEPIATLRGLGNADPHRNQNHPTRPSPAEGNNNDDNNNDNVVSIVRIIKLPLSDPRATNAPPPGSSPEEPVPTLKVGDILLSASSAGGTLTTTSHKCWTTGTLQEATQARENAVQKNLEYYDLYFAQPPEPRMGTDTEDVAVPTTAVPGTTPFVQPAGQVGNKVGNTKTTLLPTPGTVDHCTNAVRRLNHKNLPAIAADETTCATSQDVVPPGNDPTHKNKVATPGNRSTHIAPKLDCHAVEPVGVIAKSDPKAMIAAKAGDTSTIFLHCSNSQHLIEPNMFVPSKVIPTTTVGKTPTTGDPMALQGRHHHMEGAATHGQVAEKAIGVIATAAETTTTMIPDQILSVELPTSAYLEPVVALLWDGRGSNDDEEEDENLDRNVTEPETSPTPIRMKRKSKQQLLPNRKGKNMRKKQTVDNHDDGTADDDDDEKEEDGDDDDSDLEELPPDVFEKMGPKKLNNYLMQQASMKHAQAINLIEQCKTLAANRAGHENRERTVTKIFDSYTLPIRPAPVVPPKVQRSNLADMFQRVGMYQDALYKRNGELEVYIKSLDQWNHQLAKSVQDWNNSCERRHQSQEKMKHTSKQLARWKQILLETEEDLKRTTVEATEWTRKMNDAYGEVTGLFLTQPLPLVHPRV